jgi:hypothetical protein
MKVKGDQKLVPQTIEDIHDIKWVAAGNLDMYLQNTYPSVKDVLGLFMV